MIIDAFKHVFPVAGCKKDGTFEKIFGTAFPILNNYYVTAAHVIESAAEHESYALLNKSGKRLKFVEINDIEVFQNYDLAILEVQSLESESREWCERNLSMLEDVYTVGFPHAFDYENFVLSIRSFKGETVSNYIKYDSKSKPLCYELSFQCPKGLSGAPLFLRKSNQVAGIIIGNNTSEIEILRYKETVTEKITRETVCNDAVHFGVGLSINSILNIKSKLLGAKIRDYLTSNNRLK